jgi:hypothetical protein
VLSSYHHRVSQLSKFSGGFGGEVGALIRLYRGLEASLIGHLDYINSQIGTRDSGWMGQINKNLMVTFQSGLQYHFRH